jgi:hypothetical protein
LGRVFEYIVVNPVRDLDRYWAFAEPQFAKNGDRRISYEVVASVYQRFEGITANVQRIMNMLYMLTPKGETCTLDMIGRAIDTYLQLSSAYYSELLRQMPEKQRNVFLAIAAEGQVKYISGGKFVWLDETYGNRGAGTV